MKLSKKKEENFLKAEISKNGCLSIFEQIAEASFKCVLSISSGYLENVINLPDNHNHNLQLDISCMADPTSINQLVDFAYTGKISFTAVDFDRLATAIEKLQEEFSIFLSLLILNF